MQRRRFGSRSALCIESSPPKHDIISQGASESANSSRKLEKKIPNKDRNTKDVDQVRTATEPDEPHTWRFRIPKAIPDKLAGSLSSRLDVSSLRGQKLQTWAKQTMQDVISPKAFEQWSKDQTIPKTPDDFWSASDIRKAHTLKKRHWKLSKPDFKRLELDKVPSTAPNQQPRHKDLPIHLRPSHLRPWTERSGKKAEEKLEPSTLTVPTLQAQSRTRILNEAFRGLLSPAQQHRAILNKASPPSAGGYISEPLLTKRIMNVIAMHEPGSPRERVYELLDLQRFFKNEKDTLDKEAEKSTDMQKSELKDQFSKWKTATQELKEAIEMKWPEESKKKRFKTVIEQEMSDIQQVENTLKRNILM
jgi:hypothetical protein